MNIQQKTLSNDSFFAVDLYKGYPDFTSFLLANQSIFDSLSCGMAIMDIRTESIVYANPVFSCMLGYSSPEMSGMPISAFHERSLAEKYVSFFKSLTHGSFAMVRDVPFVHKSRAQVYADVSSQIISFGTTEYALGYFKDTTVFKEAVTQMVDLRHTIEFALGATGTGVHIVDNTYFLRYVDPQWAAKYGRYNGRKCFEYFTGKKEACLGCGISKAFKTKQRVVTEGKLSREGNRPIQITATPFRGASGEWFVAAVNVDISERKTQENALSVLEQRYRSVVDNAGVGVALLTPQFEILTLNRKMREWFPEINPALKPICYKAYNNPPREKPCAYCPVVKTLRWGRDFESLSDTPSGAHCRNFRIISSPVKDAQGGIIAIVEIVEDLTAQQALLDNAVLLRHCLDRTSDTLLVLNARTGCVLDCNAAALEKLGYTRGQLMGVHISCIDTEILMSTSWESLCRRLKRRKEIAFTGMHQHKDKTTMPVEGTLKYLATGSNLYVVVIAHDVAERRLIEERLRFAEAGCRGMMDGAGSCIVKLDASGKLLFFNTYAEKFFGYTRTEVLGKPILEILAVPGSHRNKGPAGFMYRMLAKKNAQDSGIAENRTKDGRSVWVAWTARRFYDAKGRYEGMLGIGSDVTELHTVQEKLRKNQKDLAESEANMRFLARRLLSVREEEKKRLGADLHDEAGAMAISLQTLLTIAIEDVRDGKKKQALRSLRRVKSLLQESSVYLRNLSTELRLPQLELVGLGSSLRSLIESMGVARLGIKVSVSCAPALERFSGDGALPLYRITQESLTNIVKHARAKHVNILVSAVNSKICLRIWDDGVGFFSSHGRPKHTFLKIGIQGMRERAAAVGGNVTIRSVPGSGTLIQAQVPYHLKGVSDEH